VADVYGTVQPLRSEIKAAVASHTQFEHMKKGGQRSSGLTGKPTGGLTFLLQGADKITVPAIFPVTSNLFANCDSPEVPSAAKRKPNFFPELRAMRSALAATHNGAVVATAARTGCWPAQRQGAKTDAMEKCFRALPRTCVRAVESAARIHYVACETGFLRAEKSAEDEVDKRHSKHSTTQPREGPGRQAHMGHNKKGCCSSLLRFPAAATTDEMREKRLESVQRCLLVSTVGMKRAQQKPRGQEACPLVVCLLIPTNIKRGKAGLRRVAGIHMAWRFEGRVCGVPFFLLIITVLYLAYSHYCSAAAPHHPRQLRYRG